MVNATTRAVLTLDTKHRIVRVSKTVKNEYNEHVLSLQENVCFYIWIYLFYLQKWLFNWLFDWSLNNVFRRIDNISSKKWLQYFDTCTCILDIFCPIAFWIQNSKLTWCFFSSKMDFQLSVCRDLVCIFSFNQYIQSILLQYQTSIS